MPNLTRILFICHDGDLYGSQQSLLLLAEHLPPKGYECYISLARKGPLNERLERLPGVTTLSHQRLQWVKHDARTPLQRLGDVLGLLFGALPRTGQIYRHIRQHRIQIVHTNSMVSLEGALAAYLARVPHCWHIRELFMEENPKLQMVLGKRLTRWLIHTLSSRVISISKAVQQQFTPYLADSKRYPVLYNAMAEAPPAQSQAAYPPPSPPWRIGYIGRLSAGKRFQDLLEAFSELRQRSSVPIELCVAGNFVDEAFEGFIRKRVQELKVEDSVHFLGYQPQLEALYESLHVLVVPSLNEPFGRVVIEAMRAGVPCIAANSGGIPEIITDGQTGLLYPAKDVAALTSLLQQAMANPERLGTIRENAGRMVQDRFTIEEQMKSLSQIYQSLLSQETSCTS